MRKTQKELQALYEEQQSETGKTKLESKKKMAAELYKKVGVKIPVDEVGILKNLKTGKNEYFMMIRNER